MREGTADRKGPRYDKKDRKSILRHAAKLTGHMLSDFEEMEMESTQVQVKG